MEEEIKKTTEEVVEETEMPTIDFSTPTIEENIEEAKPKKKKTPVVLLIVLLLVLAGVLGGFFYLKKLQDSNNSNNKKENTSTPVEVSGDYTMTGNDLQEIDLYFLKLENNGKNIVYSPLSIKYALEMLSEGAQGETKTQLDTIIGKYSARKYTNSNNLSLGNALFVRDTYKEAILPSYTETLRTKYNAEVITDSFAKPDVVNNWISEKTFKLIPKLVDTLADNDFVLVNALAIDMEWVNKIRALYDDYIVNFAHEEFSVYIDSLTSGTGYHKIKFEGTTKEIKSVEIGAVANKYDAIADIGEDKIRETITKEYNAWLAEGACGEPEKEPKAEVYVEQFLDELRNNYKNISSSTDFLFYDDSNVKIFAKDLKEYNGVTLQYVGIMPKEQSLKEYISNTNAKSLNELLTKIKPLDLDSFEEGYVTQITGEIPMFSYNYQLNLMDDLKSLGVSNIFDSGKADLTKLAKSGAYINTAEHKANIDFSNDGIKAAAATSVGGKGATSCGFDHKYEVPVKKIDLTFNKPFMYLVRDKSTGEVWFTGAVYEPTEITNQDYDEFGGQ